MKYFFQVGLACILTAIFCSFLVKRNSYQIYTSSFENVLGTSLDMKFSAANESAADIAELSAINEIKRLNNLLSSYDENSAFSKWAQTNNEELPIPTELKEVLQQFDHWTSITNGKLTPAIGVLHSIWKEAEKKQQLPTNKSITVATEEVNQKHWILTDGNKAIHLTSTPLLLNTFVKSYIINKAIDKAMETEGINGALVNIGGDIVIKGAITESISIEDPTIKSDNVFENNIIQLQNTAIATSGNYKRGYIINGEYFSHIINPINGLPADHIKSATVIAKDPITAGALATAFNVMSVEESKKIANNFKDVEYHIITSDNKTINSAGWNNALTKKTTSISATINAKAGKEKRWNPSYEATINIELARLEGFARRPFIAIWIVNSNNQTVKNIALWFNKPRWLPDLKEWYHQNYLSYSAVPQGVSSISSATRPAGNYIFKWDGKDEKGAYVPEGKYTVYIEAAREHGTYQLMKREFNANEKEQTFTLPGNVEIATATVSYKKNQ